MVWGPCTSSVSCIGTSNLLTSSCSRICKSSSKKEATSTNQSSETWTSARPRARMASITLRQGRHTTHHQRYGKMSPTVTSRTFGRWAAWSTRCSLLSRPSVAETWTISTKEFVRESFQGYPSTTRMTSGPLCSLCFELIQASAPTQTNSFRARCSKYTPRSSIVSRVSTWRSKRRLRARHLIAHKSATSPTTCSLSFAYLRTTLRVWLPWCRKQTMTQ